MAVLKLLASLVVAMGLVGCTATVRPAKTEVKVVPGVQVELDADGPGKFCPPGHAKKGWC
jgi:hypothetical protein